VLSALRRSGLLYPCRCSRRLLADVSAPHGGWPVYPGFCRLRPARWGPDAGRLPSWRLRLQPGPIRWLERYGPPGRLDGAGQVGDVVLRRADGFLAYHLATAVDELSLGISDVLRGEDLWPSTGAQVALIGLLGAPPPRYGHLPLWLDGSGSRLSKREGAEGLEGWRQQGLDAPAVIGLLASSTGLVPAGSRLSARELLEELTPERFDAGLRSAVFTKASGSRP
jgi:glutamyl-tRNA synthetase